VRRMNLMLKVIGFGLLGMFVLMIFPSVMTDVATEPMFYGTANIVLADSDGNALMKQTVHNRITDQGEEFIIDQVFDTADAAQTDNTRVGAICILSTSDSNISETSTDTTTNNLVGGTNRCHQTTDITDAGASLAVTDATVFTSGIDFNSGQEISAILICQKDAGDGDFVACSTPTSSSALAAISITNVTVSGSDTITITYTFNIVTAGS